MKKIIVLGAGLVGSTIAKELSADYQVTSVDSNQERLTSISAKNVNTLATDLSSLSEIKKVISDFDLVIGALPGFMGFNTLKSIIEAGKNVVDISFFPEDPFLLDKLSKEKNVTAIVDCGVSPGLSNIILGYHNQRMKIENYKCIVGGLPYKREWPFEYKAYFSPVDVIEEYIRPARIVIDANVIEKPALSEPEIINYNEVGELEAFNTDGLRSLLKTMTIPNMIEKTLRYPGHIELMKVFRETGFFSDKEITVNGKTIKPVELTAKLLFPFWQPDRGERDFTILELFIEGVENERKSIHQYYMIDSYDPVENNSSMARTTGFTCCAAARYLLEYGFENKGICAPEFLGVYENFYDYILSYLNKKKINIVRD